ncbi:3-hydroxyacyl-CoA dehydrogenase NAD-binding domain-containing protein, partial [Streptococcus suis]
MARPSFRGQSGVQGAPRTRASRRGRTQRMPFDPNQADVTVGVVGTGSMGRGIMQVSAQGGMRVIAFDEKPGAAQAARDYIAKMLAR